MEDQMKSRLITLAACLLVAGELSAATTKTTATADTDVNAAAVIPVTTAQLVDEESPALDKTLGKRGAIERRMSDAAEKRRISRESTSTVSGTVLPR
jgi:hypothetical protein